MGLLYVARHGETDWNREGRYQGQRESRLTELGMQQALALCAALSHRGISRIVSSPLGRCVETARPLADAVSLPVETDARLLEIAHGTWEGRLRDDVARDDGARLEEWRRHPERVQFPGGESLEDVDRRWKAFANALASDGGTLVVLTHDVLVRLAVLWAQGRPPSELWQPRVENGSYAVIEVSHGAPRLVEEACVEHLAGIRADATRQAL